MCPASVIGAGLRPAFSPKSLVPAGHKMVPAAVRKGRHLSGTLLCRITTACPERAACGHAQRRGNVALENDAL